MSAAWHWLVVLMTVGSIAGWLWLLFANARRKPGEETTGHVWDDDLREYNNPLPRWWLNLFVITIVFAIGYLVVYPGLGEFPGTGDWTQQKQLDRRLAAVKAQRQKVYAALGDRDVAALARDAAVLSLGRELFLGNCAGCHGADARGALGFPDLSDRDWLYGGTPEAILASIGNGRQGQMPAFNGALTPEAVAALVEWLARRDDATLPAGTRGAAERQFAIACAACHGADATGNVLLGAPNLADRTWLHGGAREAIRHTILFGRRGNMPAHKDILGADDLRVVASYVYSLSAPP